MPQRTVYSLNSITWSTHLESSPFTLAPECEKLIQTVLLLERQLPNLSTESALPEMVLGALSLARCLLR